MPQTERLYINVILRWRYYSASRSSTSIVNATLYVSANYIFKIWTIIYSITHITQTIYHKDIFVISECTQKQFYILHLSHYVPEGRASFQQSDRSTTGNYTLRIYSSTPIVANLWTVQVTVRYRDCSIEVLCTWNCTTWQYNRVLGEFQLFCEYFRIKFVFRATVHAEKLPKIPTGENVC